MTWQYGNRLTKYGTTTFAYDGAGRRTTKGSISFTYDSDGRLVKQSNGLEFVYDASGLVGVKYNGVQYFCLIQRDDKAVIIGCQGSIIPNDVTSIMGAFSGYDGLMMTVIPDNVTRIGAMTFYDCRNLASVVIGNGVRYIGECAFMGCDSLTSIAIGSGVTEILNGTFSWCENFTEIRYSGTKTQWKAISKGWGWNEDTGNYTVICMDGTFTKSES